ncbi:hypothetical protein RFI_06187 [Reticulomyxa filosa]|uniref:Transmembrane protein n=1 Tax=Reticulomyxa filosa TaxID=46433 RepID=X6NYI3_RETFI|nr:hypothetical protein RFI_06187 [Reticulomyxa filosa]|eukprot:ETO30933.1 hypothetical protein RFI_06187 [Reticulomyxa filosa]
MSIDNPGIHFILDISCFASNFFWAGMKSHKMQLNTKILAPIFIGANLLVEIYVLRILFVLWSAKQKQLNVAENKNKPVGGNFTPVVTISKIQYTTKDKTLDQNNEDDNDEELENQPLQKPLHDQNHVFTDSTFMELRKQKLSFPYHNITILIVSHNDIIIIDRSF